MMSTKIGDAVETRFVPALTGAISISEYEGAYEERKLVVRFAGGKHLLVSQRMADLILEIDGARDAQQIAGRLAERWGVPVKAGQIEQIIRTTLMPVGLAREAARPAEAIAPRRGADILGHSIRCMLIPSRYVQRITPRLEWMYAWPVAAAALIAIIWSRVLLYRSVPSVNPIAGDPATFLYVFLLVTATVFVHEFGHATAVSRWGGRPGDIGFTLYIVYPALYTDTSDSWRFPRWQRAAVDAGGAYFQLLASAPLAFYAAASDEAVYLLTCAAIDSMLVFSLNPFFKFDGYWIVSDLLGVPNLHKNALRSLAWRSSDGEERLSRWSRAALRLYAVLMLGFIAGLIYLTFAYGVRWVANYPALVRATFEGAIRGAGGGTAAAGALLQFLFQTATLIGLLVFWQRLASAAGKWLRAKWRAGHAAG